MQRVTLSLVVDIPNATSALAAAEAVRIAGQAGLREVIAQDVPRAGEDSPVVLYCTHCDVERSDGRGRRAFLDD